MKYYYVRWIKKNNQELDGKVLKEGEIRTVAGEK